MTGLSNRSSTSLVAFLVCVTISLVLDLLYLPLRSVNVHSLLHFSPGASLNSPSVSFLYRCLLCAVHSARDGFYIRWQATRDASFCALILVP